MKHRYYVYRTVTYRERVVVHSDNIEKAREDAQWTVDNDWDDTDIDRDTLLETNWVAELDEEGLVEDLLNTPDSKCLDDVVETMFEVKK